MLQVVPAPLTAAQKWAQDLRRVPANLFFALPNDSFGCRSRAGRGALAPKLHFLVEGAGPGGGCDLGGDGEQQAGGGMRPAAE